MNNRQPTTHAHTCPDGQRQCARSAGEAERAARLRLVADRLCYLAEGDDGLRIRYGMQDAVKGYRDQYDAQAEQLQAAKVTA